MSDRLITVLAVLVIACSLCTVWIPFVRTLAVRLGIVDLPGDRKLHRHPVPLLGGLAIYLTLVFVVGGCLFLLPDLLGSPLGGSLHKALRAVENYHVVQDKLWALLAGSTVIVAVGIADDARGVAFPPAYKLGGQLLAAAVLLPAGIYMDLFNWNTPLAMLLSVLWVVSITNSMNLLDNMDGLSSGVALICASMFLVLVILRGEFFVALLLAAIIGATLGFYPFNIRKDRGKIFLGDTGSLLLGYLLGALSLIARYVDATDTSLFPVLSPVIILGLPVFDTASVIVIRLHEGRPVFSGDQMHLSHRLVRMGMTIRQAVFFNYLLTLAIGMNAFFIINSRIMQSVLVVIQVCVLVAMVTILMSMRAGGSRNGIDDDGPILGD